MIIEIYREGDNHPALYDLFITRKGKQVPMIPAPPLLQDLYQIVLEKGAETPNDNQLALLGGVKRVMKATLLPFFDTDIFEHL